MDNNANDNEKSPKSNGYNLRNTKEDNEQSSDSTSDEDYNPETNNCSLNNEDFKKFLYELFPSKYLKNKVKSNDEKKKKKIKKKKYIKFI